MRPPGCLAPHVACDDGQFAVLIEIVKHLHIACGGGLWLARAINKEIISGDDIASHVEYELIA